MQLVINKFGTALRVKDGQFAVYQDGEPQLVPMGHVKSIVISRSCLVSAEAIASAVEREIDLSFVERNGQPYARVWSHKYGSISTIRKNQLRFTQDGPTTEWVIQLLATKMDNQSALLHSLQLPDHSTTAEIEKTVERIQRSKDKLFDLRSKALEEAGGSIRGLEGSASRAYFQCVSIHLPEPLQFERRSQRPARDMFNALLNYAYGMLYNLVERSLIQAGVDPYVGIWHRDEYNRPVLAYDVIERFRAWAEYPVIDLCLQEVIFPEFFSIEEDGAYWLEDTGKRLLVTHVNDYLAELVVLKGRSRSRQEHIRLYGHELATTFKNYNQT